MALNQRLRSAVIAACLASSLSGCITIERADQTYPPVPTGVSEVIYVSTAGDDDAAGTSDAPLRTIQAALDVAASGAAVVVAAGEYGEELVIDRSVTVVGGGGSDVKVGVAGLSVVLHVSGQQTEARLVGLHIFGAVTASGLIKEATVVLEECIVQGGDVGLDLNEGLGLVVAQGGRLVLQGGQIGGHAGTGVVAWEGAVEIHGTLVASNGMGGVVAQDASEPTVIDQAVITANLGFGVAAMGSDLVLTRSTIELTLGFGDGVLAAASETRAAGEVLIGGPAACAVIGADDCANDIRDNQRFGVLVDGASGGVVGNLVNGNGSGGVWLQHGDTTFEVSGNTIADNRMVGVAVAAGASCDVVDNIIETTRATLALASPDEFGDGVAVLSGGVALVTGNTIRDSERAGVFLSWVGLGTTLGMNTFQDNEADILCQGDLSCDGAPEVADGAAGAGSGGGEPEWTEVGEEEAPPPNPSYSSSATADASDVISEDDEE